MLETVTQGFVTFGAESSAFLVFILDIVTQLTYCLTSLVDTVKHMFCSLVQSCAQFLKSDQHCLYLEQDANIIFLLMIFGPQHFHLL